MTIPCQVKAYVSAKYEADLSITTTHLYYDRRPQNTLDVTQWRFNVVPLSATPAQYRNNISGFAGRLV